MRCFLTGATGFIGGRIAGQLAADGHEVTALVRPTSSTGALERIGATLCVGDVRQPATYRSAMRDADRVYHAAAVVDVVKPRRSTLLDTNVEGTRHVLETAQSAGTGRVIHLSSVAALGDAPDRLADETDEPQGRYKNAYQESKHRADRLARQAADQGLDVVRVMPSIVVGYGDPKTGRVLRRFLRGRIPVVPRSRGVASYVHIRDLLDGIERAAANGPSGEAYVFTQVNWSHEALLATLEELTGVPAPRRRIGLPAAWTAALAEEAWASLSRRPARFSRQTLAALRRHHAFSSAKARKDLGWRPEDFKTRLAQTLRCYQEDLRDA